MSKKRKLTDAQKIFADLLKIESRQSIASDAKTIAKVIGKNEDTVRLYLKGDVYDLTVASYILTELRKLVQDRKEFAMEHAA